MGTQQTPPQGRLEEQSTQQPQQQGAAAAGPHPDEARQLTPEEQEAGKKLLEQVEEKRPRTSNSELLQLVVDSGEKQGYARQIVEAELVRDAFDQDWRLAKVFALSGQFDELKKLSQMQAISTAMAKIQLGRSWGLTPGDSMQFVIFTNGRPSIMNEMVASKLQAAGWGWEIYYQREGVWGKPEGRCTGCRLWITLKGEILAFPVRKADGQIEIDPNTKLQIMRPVSVEFSKADADKAFIWEKGKQVPLSSKWNFLSWPEDMYFFRCIGRLKKRYAPDVFRGAAIQAEAEDIVTGHEFIDVSPVTPPTHNAREAMREDDAPSQQETVQSDTKSANGAPNQQPSGSGGRPPVRPINNR